jgi:hypothetical protein
MACDAAWAPDAARDRGLSPPPAASRVRSSSQSIRSSAKVRVFGFSRTRRSVGSLEVGEHQDVQQLGAGSRTEGVETRSKPPFEVSGTPYPEPSMRAPEIIPLLVVPLLGDLPFRGRDDPIRARLVHLDRLRPRIRYPSLPRSEQALLRLTQHHRPPLRADPVPPSPSDHSLGSSLPPPPCVSWNGHPARAVKAAKTVLTHAQAGLHAPDWCRGGRRLRPACCHDRGGQS